MPNSEMIVDNGTGSRPSRHAHKAVAKVAAEAAAQLYELLMGNNEIRAAWKVQNPGLGERALLARFVAKNQGRCLEFARATLAASLRGPADDATKDAILEALCLDATLLRGRGQ